jgi:Cyanate lyase
MMTLREALGLGKGYEALFLHAQAQQKPESEGKLVQLVPGLSKDLVAEMRKCPMRSYDPTIIQEPNIYRMTEGGLHYGESIKEVKNEKFGEGIMSAIDFKITLDKIKGDKGEDRMVVTMNGKFLPHIQQNKQTVSVK